MERTAKPSAQNLAKVRERILSNVANELRVDIEELASISGLTLDKGTGIVYISHIDSLPREVLLDILTKTSGVIEYIGSLKAATLAARDILKSRLETEEAKKRNEVQEKLDFARGSKAKADQEVLADEDLKKLRIQIAYYNAYLDYLKSLEDLFAKQHYVAKEAVGSNSSAFSRLLSSGGAEDAVF